jgi:F0F1-type ATP synthase assembly protein I
MEGPDPERLRKWGRFVALGPFFAGSIAVGSLLGWWIDKRLGTAPLVMVIGLLLGAAAGFVELFRAASEAGRSRRRRGRGGPFGGAQDGRA